MAGYAAGRGQGREVGVMWGARGEGWMDAGAPRLSAFWVMGEAGGQGGSGDSTLRVTASQQLLNSLIVNNCSIKKSYFLYCFII